MNINKKPSSVYLAKMALNFIKETNEKASQSSTVSCYRISSQSMSLSNNFQTQEKLREEAKYLIVDEINDREN